MKQRGYLLISEAGDATPYARDEEFQLGMSLGESDEFIDIGPDSLYAPLHRRDSVRLPLQSNALAPYGAKLVQCGTGSASAMITVKVAAEYEYLIGLERVDIFRCIFHFIKGLRGLYLL